MLNNPCRQPHPEHYRPVCPERLSIRVPAETELPLRLIPSANVVDVSSVCCGEPKVLPPVEKCDGTCELVILQQMQVRVTVACRVDAGIGECKLLCS